MELCLGIAVFFGLILGLYFLITYFIKGGPEAGGAGHTGKIDTPETRDQILGQFEYRADEWHRVLHEELLGGHHRKFFGPDGGFSLKKRFDIVESPPKICFFDEKIVISNGNYSGEYYLNSPGDPRYGIFLTEINLRQTQPMNILEAEIYVKHYDESPGKKNFNIPLPRSADQLMDKIMENYYETVVINLKHKDNISF